MMHPNIDNRRKLVYKSNFIEKKVKKHTNKYLVFILAGLSIILLGIVSFFWLNSSKYKQEPYIQAHQSVRNFSDIQLPQVQEDITNDDLSKVDVSAKSALVYSLDTYQILLSKNIQEQKYIASLTKLMTAMVASDNYTSENKELNIQNDLPDVEGGLGLKAGSQISLNNALNAALVGSLNDSAYVIANEYGYDSFISKMNEKAQILGLTHTHFSTPIGLDEAENYSTASDLLKISLVYLNYPSLTKISSQKSAIVNWTDSNSEQKTVTVFNTNTLLSAYKGVSGLKTGYTGYAGECLITYYENTKGRFLIVILDSQDRFEDTKKILQGLE